MSNGINPMTGTNRIGDLETQIRNYGKQIGQLESKVAKLEAENLDMNESIQMNINKNADKDKTQSCCGNESNHILNRIRNILFQFIRDPGLLCSYTTTQALDRLEQEFLNRCPVQYGKKISKMHHTVTEIARQMFGLTQMMETVSMSLLDLDECVNKTIEKANEASLNECKHEEDFKEDKPEGQIQS